MARTLTIDQRLAHQRTTNEAQMAAANSAAAVWDDPEKALHLAIEARDAAAVAAGELRRALRIRSPICTP